MLILECSQRCYAVKIWPGDLDLWPWKSIGFQILLRTKYVPNLVKIHWRMLILECSQENLEPYWFSRSKVNVTRSNFYHNILVNTLESTSFNGFWPSLVHGESGTLLIFKVKGQGVKYLPHNILVNTLESTSFNGFWPNLVRTMYVPSLVKIHWRILILECSQGCYVVKIWPGNLENQ
jgi:hypothetical protein